MYSATQRKNLLLAGTWRWLESLIVSSGHSVAKMIAMQFGSG